MPIFRYERFLDYEKIKHFRCVALLSRVLASPPPPLGLATFIDITHFAFSFRFGLSITSRLISREGVDCHYIIYAAFRELRYSRSSFDASRNTAASFRWKLRHCASFAASREATPAILVGISSLILLFRLHFHDDFALFDDDMLSPLDIDTIVTAFGLVMISTLY